MLALMSRLLAARSVAALAEGDGLRVAVAKGAAGLAVGDAVDGAKLATDFPLVVELRHGGRRFGVVGLGPRLGGAVYGPAEEGLARSLANATAATLAARQSAEALVGANRALAARAHGLRTLLELAQTFGQALDREAIAGQIARSLMGQLLVPRVAVALCDDDEGPLETVLARGAPAPEVPRALARLERPAVIDDPALAETWRWAVPLRAGDLTRGAVVLGAPFGTPPDWYPDRDTSDFVAALAALAVGAFETADRVEERLERERLREEVRLAREVQARLLPETLPAIPGLDIAAQWRPSHEVSGDTYHAADVGGRLLVAVADVVGKGIGASLLMATLQAGFRLAEPDLAGDTPAAALVAATGRLDRLVFDSTEVHQFVTLAWAVVAPDGAVVSVVAGHPPPRIVRADGRVEALATGGPLLGVVPGAAFEAGIDHLAPGDALVFYTDGVTEAQDADGDELGPEGLDRALAPAPSAKEAVEAVEALVAAWSAEAPEAAEDDDLTVLVVHREHS
ncbi:PP2C family protein-serine/threonine phosphatase [Rubrivirga sp. IMCC43871]|uniref:PP2C family protein-serine/threonine phosphatase n=1 Tax=Rubrivirga sp. IMCC43871 TaxID=3391575 RepID=UPI00398FD931